MILWNINLCSNFAFFHIITSLSNCITCAFSKLIKIFAISSIMIMISRKQNTQLKNHRLTFNVCLTKVWNFSLNWVWQLCSVLETITYSQHYAAASLTQSYTVSITSLPYKTSPFSASSLVRAYMKSFSSTYRFPFLCVFFFFVCLFVCFSQR